MTRIENYDLSAHNTFRMKVKCALYIEYSSVAELQALSIADLPQPVMHIGAGSNLLFTKDFPGTVLHSKVGFVKFVDMGLDEVLMTVGAGVVFDDFVARTCKEGLWGAENLSLIPGEVGAAAVQNIGAYGVEVKDIIAGVVCLDTRDWTKTVFKMQECGYGYRDSMFKHQKGRYIVTSVLFRLTRKYSPKLDYGGVRKALEAAGTASSAASDTVWQSLTPQAVRDAIIGIRRQKLPDPADVGSAGSFFKNPVVPREVFDAIAAKEGDVPHYVLEDGSVKIPAAWLIDRCGFKGASEGGAQVYEKQPLVIVNASGEAAAADVLKLENRIIATVQGRFGITLNPEVEHV
ncbi:MAG: UDP-N-acetylmuramate dehydrogenase [Bacteroidales bacterium]|nr:UDP-N-acetylmuramate dehydrogenase [Bacteroidales bacterium]